MNEKINKIIETYKEKTRKNCYVISLLGEEPSVIDSKLGGIPYMKEGETYPKDSKGIDMPLFIQINFSDFELENYPTKGLLQLFVDKELGYPVEYKVRYIENTDEPYNTNLPEIDLKYFAVKKAIKISFKPGETYMPINDFKFNDTFCKIFNEVYNTNIDSFYNYKDIIEDRNIDIDMLINNALNIEPGLVGGYADFTQSDPRSNAIELEKLTECIVKIDSNLDMDLISIGDAGIAWLLISEEDLKAKKFENASFDWDCC